MFRNELNAKVLFLKSLLYLFLLCLFTGDENNAEDLQNYILTTYPKLVNCGGFEILKTSGMTRSRKLVVLPCPNTGYTIKTLKENMGHAVVYIRPMQKDIHLSNSVSFVFSTVIYLFVDFCLNYILRNTIGFS